MRKAALAGAREVEVYFDKESNQINVLVHKTTNYAGKKRPEKELGNASEDKERL